VSERIERVVTSGTFSLDGGCWDVDNNVWIVGNDSSVIIIDPAHDVDKISRTVAGRTVEKILLTHAHDDHIRSAKEAAERFGAPVYLNPADRVLWEMVYPSWDFDHELADGDVLRIGETELTVLAPPSLRKTLPMPSKNVPERTRESPSSVTFNEAVFLPRMTAGCPHSWALPQSKRS